MIRRHSNQIALAAFCLAPLLFSGCSSPRFRDKQARRDDRIRHNVGQFQKRERESRENLDQLFAVHQTMVERHGEHRESSRKLIERRIQRRQVERRENMQEFLDVFRRNNPDSWPDTWAKMYY